MGKYTAYPEYKDSGVEWLGEVPAHWSTIRIGFMFRRVKRTGHPDEQLLSVYRDYGVIPKDSRDDNWNKASDDLSTYQLVREGDLVLNKMKAWQGSVGISEHRGIVSPAYFVYEPQPHINKRHSYRFQHYLLRSPIYFSQYNRLSKGIRVNQWDLDPDHFKSVEVLLPPPEEQTQIAAFLDHETAKIDRLIAKQEELIALLQEKRQAVISHAVTKGLDPDAPMKDSGVEWLGEVPAHWEIKKLKQVAEIIDCKNRTPTYFENGSFLVVRTTNVKEGELTFDNALYTDLENFTEWTKRGTPIPGSILFTREAPAGEICIVPKDLPLCLGQRMMNIRSTIGSKYNNYLIYYFMTHQFKDYVKSQSSGSTVSHLRVEQVYNIPVCVPCISEFASITAFLLPLLNKLTSFKEQAIRAISLLQERRTALISAAVTGKIDVREWTP